MDDHGSVVVFNAAFEKGVLTRCAELFAEFEPWVKKVKRRMLDLLTPFKSRPTTIRNSAATHPSKP